MSLELQQTQTVAELEMAGKLQCENFGSTASRQFSARTQECRWNCSKLKRLRSWKWQESCNARTSEARQADNFPLEHKNVVGIAANSNGCGVGNGRKVAMRELRKHGKQTIFRSNTRMSLELQQTQTVAELEMAGKLQCE